VTDGGSGYTRAPTVTFFSAAGTGAQADATIVGSIGIIRIVNGGFGYDPARPPAVRFVPAVGSGGTGATGTANVDATGRVISITVTSPGVGYSLDKTTIEIDPPPENTSPDIATARAIVDPATTRIVGFEMINKGSGYGEVPAISVASPVVAFSALRPVATVTGDAVSAVSFQSGTGLVVRVNAVNAAQGFGCCRYRPRAAFSGWRSSVVAVATPPRRPSPIAGRLAADMATRLPPGCLSTGPPRSTAGRPLPQPDSIPRDESLRSTSPTLAAATTRFSLQE
jgi:hypothetical protein